jgi:hypothetical protein
MKLKKLNTNLKGLEKTLISVGVSKAKIDKLKGKLNNLGISKFNITVKKEKP